MKNWFNKDKLLATSLLAGLVVGGITVPAQAQEGASTSEEIVVTGTRIRDANLTAASPVTVVGADEFKSTGTTIRVEDLLNSLPQITAGQTTGVSNGSDGTASVDLRGLGVERTLVLIDGRRLVPGTPLNPVADLNFIPGAIIERVEVLTGGASAVYGADAVAGVVNFITKQNFEGIQFDYQYGFYQHKNDNDRLQALNKARNFSLPDENVSDGFSSNYSVLMGINSPNDKGNATFFATYRNIQGVNQFQRDYSACTLNPAADFFACAGSNAGPANVRFLVIPQFNAALGTPSSNNTIDAAGNLTPYVGARDAFNFAPLNLYQRPDERVSFGANMNYEFNDRAEIYAQAMFAQTTSTAQIAPSGLFSSNPSPLPCSNILLTAAQRTAFCGTSTTGVAQVNIGRRLPEGGPRQTTFEYNQVRGVFGVRGELVPEWSYDIYAQYGRSGYNQNYENDFSRIKVNRALDVVAGPGGTPVCRSVLDGSDQSCVPLNLFRPGGLNLAAIDYISAPGLQSGAVEEVVVNALISGPVQAVKLPTSESPLRVAGGLEFRQQDLTFNADELYRRGLLFGLGGETLPVNGTYDVFEVFGEAILPLIEGAPFAKALDLELGARYSDYSSAGTNSSYKAMVNWAFSDDVRLRFGYNRAARAPNILELFSPRELGLWSGADGCAGTPTFTLAQCARTGVTAAQYGTVPDNVGAFQYNQFTRGSTSLDVETADTITVGFVLSPSFLPGLTASIDYYSIKVEDTIDEFGAQFTLDRCATTGDARFCGLIRRDAAGSLWASEGAGIIQDTQNLGSLSTSGVDLIVGYRLGLGEQYGDLSFRLAGTYQDKYEVEPVAGLGKYDCVGFYGTVCEEARPDWRHRFTVNWDSPWNVSLGATWRHIASVEADGESSNPLLAGSPPPVDRKIDAFNYFDLNGSVELGKRYTFNAGVTNVADKEPPLISQFTLPSTIGNGNTLPGTYDALGRYIFLGISAKF